MAHFLVELGNKVPVAYFYTMTIFLVLYFYKNRDPLIMSLMSANNVFYLFFSAITVLWFVPGFLGIISEISSTSGLQSTLKHSKILFRMSYYLFITLLPTFLAIAFVVRKNRRSIRWALIVMFWTSPLASLMLRLIWWDVKCIWKPDLFVDQVFQWHFFRHVDITLFYTILLNTLLLFLVYRIKILPALKIQAEIEKKALLAA